MYTLITAPSINLQVTKSTYIEELYSQVVLSDKIHKVWVSVGKGPKGHHLLCNAL